MLGAAVDAGMIAQSPCQRVPLPKIEREEMRFLTPAEIARLADAIRPRYRALVLVGAYGGLRIGELAGLRRSRVDLLRGTVEVAEIVTEVGGQLQVGRPRPAPAAAPSDYPAPWSRSSPPTWQRQPSPMLVFTGPTGRTAADYRLSRSHLAASDQERPGWTACASTTFATRPSPCGSRPAPTPRRSPPGPGIPR